jgi:hypothetical protein
LKRERVQEFKRVQERDSRVQEREHERARESKRVQERERARTNLTFGE